MPLYIKDLGGTENVLKILINSNRKDLHSTSGKNCIVELRSVLLHFSSSVNYIVIAGDLNINVVVC